MVLLFLLIVFVCQISGQEVETMCWIEGCNETTVQVPFVVYFGAHINKLAQLDIDAQSVKIDAYIWLRWDACTLMKNDSVPNPPYSHTLGNLIDRWGLTSIPTPAECISIPGQGYYTYRAEGIFYQTMGFSNYPLDVQEIIISIEEEVYESDTIVYLPDPINPLTTGKITLPGWEVEDLIIRHGTKQYNTNFGSPEKQTSSYSTVTLGLVLLRPKAVYPLKILLPVLIVEFVSFVGFFSEIETSFDTRMGLASGSLLAAIFLQLSFGDKLPRGIEYLTLMDWMFNIAYISILYVIIETIVVKNLYKRVKGIEDQIMHYEILKKIKEEKEKKKKKKKKGERMVIEGETEINSEYVLLTGMEEKNNKEMEDIIADLMRQKEEMIHKMGIIDKVSFSVVAFLCPLLIVIVSVSYMVVEQKSLSPYY